MPGIKHSTQGVKTNDPASEISSEAWNAPHDPGETADVLTDHNKALHDALGLDAATLNAHTETQVRDHAPKPHGNEGHNSTFITQSAIESHAGLPDAHHPQTHTLASHSSKAHSELTGIGPDDHHAQGHTLASHSSKACSELSDHNKTVHDGLGIDAATLGGSTKAQVQTHAAASHGNEAHSSAFVTANAIAVDSNLSAAAQDAISKRHAPNADTDLDATFEDTLEKVAKKGAVSGYAPLDANQKVPTVNLGGAGADNTKFLRGDQTWQAPAGGGGLGYALMVQALTSSPADGATVYFGMLPKAPTTTANISKIYIRKAGTIKIAEIYCYSGTPGTAEAWSLYIRKNNTTDYLIATLSVSASERVFSNTGLSIAVAVDDYIEIKGVQPTWATNPLTTIYGGYIYIE